MPEATRVGARPCVLLTRPADDAAPLARVLADHGIDTLIEPLLRIDYLEGPALSLDGIQALLVTSANGIRAFVERQGADNAVRGGVKVYTVGEASARAAREFSFRSIERADGDVEALASLVIDRADRAAGRLLHVAGTVTAGDLARRLGAAGFAYQREHLYEAVTADRLSDAIVQAFREGRIDGVSFFSPRTARTFVTLMQAAGLDAICGGLAAFCLSPAVATAIGSLPWRVVHVASNPQQAALVTLILETLGKKR